MVSQYFVEFIFYSFLGWIWESFYCTVREKKWADRGFLFGPVCPIYGSCAVGASILFRYVPFVSDPDFPVWGIFLVCMVASAIAEYLTSYILEKRFNARWWDYSDVPLNLNGRICLPASLGFGAAGIVIVKWLFPKMAGVGNVMPDLAYEICGLVFAFLFGADFALTEASLSKLHKNMEAMHAEFNERAEQAYTKISSAPRVIAGSLSVKKEEFKEAVAEKQRQVEMAKVEQSLKRMEERDKRIEEGKQRVQASEETEKQSALRAAFIARRYASSLTLPESFTLKRVRRFIPEKAEKEKQHSVYGEKLKEALQNLEDERREEKHKKKSERKTSKQEKAE